MTPTKPSSCSTFLAARLVWSGAFAALGLALQIGCSHDWDAYDPRLGDGGAGGAGGACDAGLTPCAGGCVDTDADPAHCGACDNACPDGQACLAGACLAGCGAGLTSCGGACVDTQTDPQHCGMCDIACGNGAACLGGECACGPLTDCDGACVDTDADPAHCGGCGNACGPGAGCAVGQCACAAPQTYCGAAAGCADTSSDASHCGGCDAPCAADEICTDSACECPGATCGLCGASDLGSTVPQATSGNTVGAANDFEPSCVPPGSGEAVFTFTAPSDGIYSVDTLGSSYDTALIVLDEACAELICNDDAVGTDSRVALNLIGGQTVTIIVDGFEGEEGDFALAVQPHVGPTMDLGSAVPQTVTGSTVGAGDLLTPSCVPGGSGEITYVFTAPGDGTYTFDTLGSNYDTALHVRDGDCFGAELACNDDTMTTESLLTVDLIAGQTVIIVVDGYGGDEGNYTLNVY